MWYAVISEDHEGSLENRLAARSDHVARLKSLATEGRVLIAGPHLAVDSSDPGPAGVYRKLTIKPFNLVLP